MGGSCVLSNRQGFSLRERDDESALMHFRARSYDPRLGRFIQMDPLLSKNSSITRTYAYADHSPTALTDPLGQYSFPPDSFCAPDMRKRLAGLMKKARGRVMRTDADTALRGSAFGKDASVPLTRTLLIQYLTPDAQSTGLEVGPEAVLGSYRPEIQCLSFNGKAPHLFAEATPGRIRINTDVFIAHKDEDFLAATMIHEIGHMHYGVFGIAQHGADTFAVANRRRTGILTYAPYELAFGTFSV